MKAKLSLAKNLAAGDAKVYSYTRFSNIKQALGASSDRQGAYAERWAKENGLQLDAELNMRDEGLSAYHQKHVKTGAFGVFLKAIEDGRVQSGSVLIVEGLDRLSRAEPLQAQAQLGLIINAGITVVTASDNKLYSRESLKKNPMDLVYSLLVMIRAHEESETKSVRVSDALTRQCKAWQAGTYRGRIASGKTPGWLRYVDGKWELIPERVEALRLGISLYQQGKGTTVVCRELVAAGQEFSGRADARHLVRTLQHPAMVGDKHLLVEGVEYVLKDYYPAVLKRDEAAELIQLFASRSRKFVKGDIPSILTGLNVLRCGYCSTFMTSLNLQTTRKADGSMLDCNRRMRCHSVVRGDVMCKGGTSSASIAPVERTVIGYCSDILNLQALYGGDISAVPRRQVAVGRAQLEVTEAKLEKLMDAMLEQGDEAPAIFARRLRELETQVAAQKQNVKDAEQLLKKSTRANVADADARWRAVRAGVDALDYDARMQARQLVADTFETITVFHRGARPGKSPEGFIDIELIAKGSGIKKSISVNKKTSEWRIVETFTATPASLSKDRPARPRKAG